MRRILVLSLLVACAGHPASTECASGITCPDGTKCAAAQAVCITNSCGDGIVQESLGEKCDDGNIIDGDGCAANCLSREVCGDGFISAAAGEVCDDSNTLGGDGCAADCKSVEVCGNMIKDVGEACDDGNTTSGDGCSANCKSTETCGNGIKDVNEVCDDGGMPGGCNDDCLGGNGCGDGGIDKDANGNPIEECDDGNMSDDDDCVYTLGCKLSRCGDHIQQTTGARIEGCDDGGESFGCNLDCTQARCGDGKINKARGEQCDDGNLVNDDACKNDCTLNVCGDGVPGGPNEACDTGGNTLTCNNNCTSPLCGDHLVNFAFGEECDSGGVNAPYCDANCTVPVCGDGTTNMAAGEECDDMNAVDDDNCRTDCKLNVCGDGFRDTQAPRIEACDDGNTSDETACPYGTAVCTLCNHDCTATESLTGNVCGDGVMGGPEACDDGNTTTETACPYGLSSCTACNATCSGVVVPTTVSFCGDGTTQGPQENCDDHNNDPCGTCGSSCNQLFGSAKATGYVLAAAGAAMQDNDTLTIGDGFGTTKTFEFDKNNNGVTAGNIAVQTGPSDSAGTMAGRIRAAINASGLKITATLVGDNLVSLSNDRFSALGNVAITESVTTSDFAVSGMSGGAGGNCIAGIGCNADADCASANCQNHVCQ